MIRRWSSGISVLLGIFMGAVFGLGSCGPEHSDDPVCDPDSDPACVPAYTGCIEYPGGGMMLTCDEACEQRGGSCLAEGCDGGTYMKFSICEDDDHDGGIVSGAACDEPIYWMVSGWAQCCCVGVES